MYRGGSGPQIQQVIQLLHLLARAPPHTHHEGRQHLRAVQDAVAEIPQEGLVCKEQTKRNKQSTLMIEVKLMQ